MNLADFLSESGGAFETPRSLYIHIPFCSSRCSYCDFHSFPCSSLSASLRAEYVEKLLRRAEVFRLAMSAPIETIFIGGGTPTVLEDEVFGRLLRGIRALADQAPLEWTVEANPESLSPEKLEMLVVNGVTRLSVGIQSMDDGELAMLGRHARAADNRRAIALAAQSGLDLSADLMTALPARRSTGSLAGGSSLADSIGFLAENGVGHISVYDLVVEDGTPIKKRLDEGELLHADEDLSFDARMSAEALLANLGFSRYEVSNYALKGRECLHNHAYWSMNSYLGLGSGAASTLIVADGEKADSLGASGCLSLRVEEGEDLPAYLIDPDKEATLTWIARKESAFEMVMMALRTSRGLDEARFEARFGLPAVGALAKTIRTWKERFSENGGRLRLDGPGLDILNRILVDALDEMESGFPEAGGEVS
ncbi:MAG TPA: radical SAM family heme chaperone HemW [Rectinemataceae bacterium]|nr:radical SAM family heme chaperone HemW [Rectinemataceae bacterium]